MDLVVKPIVHKDKTSFSTNNEVTKKIFSVGFYHLTNLVSLYFLTV